MENKPDIKTFYVYANIWCPRRGLESTRLSRYFIANNLKAVSDLKKADLIVIFTCGLFADTEEASIITIEKSLKNKSAKIAITGCLLKIDPEKLEPYDEAICILPEDISNFDSLIRAKVLFKDVPNPAVVQGIHNLYWGNRWHKIQQYVKRNGNFVGALGHYINDKFLGTPTDIFFAPTTYKLEIAKGCLGNCSFCAIRIGSGKFHSFPEEQILTHFESGLKDGYRDFALVAPDIGCYGMDIQTSLPALLEKLFAVDGDFKVLLWDLGANWFVKYYSKLRLILKANSEKISKIVVPIESGSNRILKLMNRGYEIEQVKECFLDLQTVIPDIHLETQIIVGFPGETDADFQKTLEIIRAIRFSKVVVFKFDARPNTKASELPGKLSKSVIDKRVRVLTKEIQSRN